MVPEIKLEITANAVGWYGALVATAGIIISVFNFLRDKSRIVLKWKKGMRIINPGAGYKSGIDYISIEVINKGRRPVTIGSVGYLGLNKQHGIVSQSLIEGAIKIQEGEKHSYTVEQRLVPLDNVAYFIAYDQTGKGHRIRVASILAIIGSWFNQSKP